MAGGNFLQGGGPEGGGFVALVSNESPGHCGKDTAQLAGSYLPRHPFSGWNRRPETRATRETISKGKYFILH